MDESILARLTPIEKTALTLLGMGEDAASNVLKHFSRDEIQKVSNAMRSLRSVSSADAHDVFDDFFISYQQHSGIRGASKDFLANTLEKTFGSKLAKGMVTDLYGDEIKEQMRSLQWVDNESLAHFLHEEHPQMSAIFLSFLPSTSSANILAEMPTAKANELVLRMANLKTIDAQVVDDLKSLIQRCVETFTTSDTSSVDGVQQVADILNAFSGDVNALVEMLREQNAELAEQIDFLRYTFSILSFQTEETTNKLIQAIEMPLWAQALRYDTTGVKLQLQSVMPKRMADTLDEEIQNLGDIKPNKIEAAQQDIMRRVRKLDADGVIELLVTNEDLDDG